MRPIHALPTGLALVLALSSWAPNTIAGPTRPIAESIATLDQSLLLTERTPLQNTISRSIAERRARGLPVPSSVTFTLQAPAGEEPLPTPQGRQITLVATTTIHYDNPQQAGKTEWPPFEIPGSGPPDATGTITPIDYSSQIRARVEERDPGFWERHTFGQEPRTARFTERITITYPTEGAPGPGATGDAALTNDVLMGFTIVGPNLHYILDPCVDIGLVEVCAVADFGFDYGLGLRLPMQIGMTLPESMLEGSASTGSTTALGLNWLPGRYGLAGVPQELGNEFVMRLFFGVEINLTVDGSSVYSTTFGINENHSKSFASPFGPGATFDLPPIDIPLWGYDIVVAGVEIGVRLTPQLGSDRFDARWQVSGEGTGSGNLSYTNPAVALPLGPVGAIDGPGNANVTMDLFKYYFTNFALAPAVYLKLTSIFGDWTFPFGLPGVDLSAITAGLNVGPHSGTPGSIVAAIPIQNVTPTAVLDRSTAITIQGVPTFVTDRATANSFSGRARDPGRDDLTLTWDWDDGAPSPDVSTTYPVPYDVTETQSHVFGSACLSEIAFRAVDDDGAFAEDRAPVLVLPDAPHVARLEGYWLHQLGQNGETELSAGDLECLLGIVGHTSKVFSEIRDISTVQGAYDVLFPGVAGEAVDALAVGTPEDVVAIGAGAGHTREALDRDLLVTWLNFALGTYGYLEGLDTDADQIVNTTFAAFMEDVETNRLDPNATELALREEIERLRALNVARVGNVNRDAWLAGQGEITNRRVTAGSGSPDAGAARDGQPAGPEIEGIRCTSTATGTMDIAFSVAAGDGVRLGIYDIGGRRIRSFEGTYDSGTHRIHWDGRGESGHLMGSGVYILVLEKQGVVSRAKGILLR